MTNFSIDSQISLKKSMTVRRNASKNKEVLQLLFEESCSLVSCSKTIYFSLDRIRVVALNIST